MRAHFLGVRGSTPAPGEDFVRYGGYTSCVAIARDGEAAPSLLLDAGTGIRRVGTLLGGTAFDGTVVLTHLHWDHVHGLPFFTAGDRDDSRVDLYLPEQPGAASASEVLARGMSPPHFPIGPEGLRGRWSFRNLAPGVIQLEGFTVTASEIPHKGGRTYGYRVSDGTSVLTYMPDHCPTLVGPGPDGWGEYHPAALELAEGADALVHDAQLMADELSTGASFGHAAAEYAVALGRRGGARRVVLFHHQPDRTDNALDELEKRFDAETQVVVAAESLVLQL
ncbi:MAG: MBL fold metallo-hydrolase [Acidimicrobiales bacterium]